MISLVARELGLKKTALEKRQREFSGIPAELIRYADAVDIVIKLAYYKQKQAIMQRLGKLFQVLMKFISKTFSK